MVSKKTMEVNPKHSIMTELRKKAAADKSDKTVKDLIWLLFDTSLLTSDFNLEEPTQFAGRIHRMIKLGLRILAVLARAPALGTPRECVLTSACPMPAFSQ